jgi:NAD(P)-dependent dehydrogenase (short-subunit alcohol dehydrogenase family)
MSDVNGYALVTGGSAGIGQAVCETLLARGYEVVSLAHRASQLEHQKLHSRVVDLTDRAATAEVAAEVAHRWPITTFVHNAGAVRPALLAEVRVEDIDALTQLHIGCAVQLLQAVLPAMQTRRFGRVVLVSSRAALGLATRSAYSATKAAMIGLARTWALELGPHGITVNVVAPGPVRTDLFHEIVPAGSDAERQLEASIPVRRLGAPSDVARAVAFFVDPAASFVTGQVLYVCGGASVGSAPL